MKYLSNLHTHTTYCDGTATVEELILEAIKLGYASIGFSGHSYAPYDVPNCMTEDGTAQYFRQIQTLREKYEGQIEVYLGIEQDMMWDKLPYDFDYVIGSMHYLKFGEKYASVDDTAAIAENTVLEYFDGDWLAYAEEYYANAKKVADITECDIVGHFDLVTKFNENGRYFDENSLRYRTAAIDALRCVNERCNLFEINTGGVYRKKRTSPYPSETLLRELHKIGGEIVFSSDSHDKESLGFMFSEAVEIAKKCGFKYAKLLRGGKFTDVKL